MMRFIEFHSPVGVLRPYVAETCDGDALVAILWNDERPGANLAGAHKLNGTLSGVLESVSEELHAYFHGHLSTFSTPLAPVGTPFQLEAWAALRTIPFGETSTYARQAERIGRPSAVRAVGAANGRNPIPIVVPCHRVIGSNGSLTGFAGGLEAKRWLLDHERRVAGNDAPRLF
jgi:methylated-DNA-[protein]-cysteine S-methyltransferase